MSIFLILISIVSGVVAGMGIGGGSIFILLTTIFNLLEHKQAQGYNLIMFIVVGIATTIYNIKNKNNRQRPYFVGCCLLLCVAFYVFLLCRERS